MTIDTEQLLRFAWRAMHHGDDKSGDSPASSSVETNQQQESLLQKLFRVENFGRLLYFVFPALKHFVPPESLLSSSSSSSSSSSPSSSSSSWSTIETLLLLLGIPRCCIDIKAIEHRHQRALMLAIAVLFFFHAVSQDHAFQEEFAMTLPADVCRFVQSEACVGVLLRGGSIPVVALDDAATSPRRHAHHHHRQHHQDTTNAAEKSSVSNTEREPTNRQLDLMMDSDDNSDNKDQPRKGKIEVDNATHNNATEERPNHAASAAQEIAVVDEACEQVRSVLHSYADMVDAALGSPELSASSKHRHALRAGLNSVSALQSAAHEAACRTNDKNSVCDNQSSSTTSPLTQRDQNQQQRHDRHSVGAQREKPPVISASADSEAVPPAGLTSEMQEMVIRCIQERDRALAQVAELREQCRSVAQ